MMMKIKNFFVRNSMKLTQCQLYSSVFNDVIQTYGGVRVFVRDE